MCLQIIVIKLLIVRFVIILFKNPVAFQRIFPRLSVSSAIIRSSRDLCIFPIVSEAKDIIEAKIDGARDGGALQSSLTVSIECVLTKAYSQT